MLSDITDYTVPTGSAGIEAVIDPGVGVGDLVYVADNAGTLTCYKADNNSKFTDGVVTAVTGSTATICEYFTLTLANGYTADNALFLGTAGAFTNTAPAGSGTLLQKVGKALNANTILVKIETGRVIV